MTISTRPSSLTPPAAPAAGPRIALDCGPLPPAVGTEVRCAVTGADPSIDILWRAAYNPTFAEAGVRTTPEGTATFAFRVPAAALGEQLTVELVEWMAPVPLGVVGATVPSSIPAGDGPGSPPSTFLVMPGLMMLAVAVLATRRPARSERGRLAG